MQGELVPGRSDELAHRELLGARSDLEVASAGAVLDQVRAAIPTL